MKSSFRAIRLLVVAAALFLVVGAASLANAGSQAKVTINVAALRPGSSADALASNQWALLGLVPAAVLAAAASTSGLVGVASSHGIGGTSAGWLYQSRPTMPMPSNRFARTSLALK